MAVWTEKNGLAFPTAAPVGDAGSRLKSNFIKLADRAPNLSSESPTTTDDETVGFVLGSQWLNYTTFELWQCLDPTENAAEWRHLYRWLEDYLSCSSGLDAQGVVRSNSHTFGEVQAAVASGSPAEVSAGGSAPLSFGTSSPALTLSHAGRYLLFASVCFGFSNEALGSGAEEIAWAFVRRTNNAPTDIAGSQALVVLIPEPIVEGGGGWAIIQAVPYTTVGVNDSLALCGGSDGTLPTECLVAYEASLRAVWLGPVGSTNSNARRAL